MPRLSAPIRVDLITGSGGAGKSTTALLCLQAGLAYLGDDYVVIALDPVPTAYSLYCTAKLNDDQAAKFPGLLRFTEPRKSGRRVGAEPEKTVLRLHPGRVGPVIQKTVLFCGRSYGRSLAITRRRSLTRRRISIRPSGPPHSPPWLSSRGPDDCRKLSSPALPHFATL